METPKHFEPKQTTNLDGDFYTEWCEGYNECLEKTNAKELYEAAAEVVTVFIGDKPWLIMNALEKLTQALDNANK